MSPDRRRRGPVGLLVALLLLSGCGAGSVEDERGAERPVGHRTITLSPIPVPRGLHLSFLQERIDEGTRRAAVRVVNGTDGVLPVQAVRLDWGGFPAGGWQRVRADVAPGQTLDLRYRLPPAGCGTVRARPVLLVRTSRRSLRRSPDPAGLRFLHRLREAECGERALRRDVDVAYGGPWRVRDGGDEPVLEASVVLTRRGGSTRVGVEQVLGSVLFDLALARPAGLGARAPRAAVPLEVTPGRCDEHARSQATQPFTFRVWFRRGASAGPLTPLVLRPTAAQQRRLLTFLSRACAGITQH